jgi:hypothetical protein
MATIKGLRGVLGAHFDEAETVLRRLAEAGVLPSGRPGVGGRAAIEPPHCVMAVLGLASLAWCDPSPPLDSPGRGLRDGLSRGGNGGSISIGRLSAG